MEVRVTVTVDVDVAAWRLEYGTSGSDQDVADDVRRYVENVVHSQLASVGVLADQ